MDTPNMPYPLKPTQFPLSEIGKICVPDLKERKFTGRGFIRDDPCREEVKVMPSRLPISTVIIITTKILIPILEKRHRFRQDSKVNHAIPRLTSKCRENIPDRLSASANEGREVRDLLWTLNLELEELRLRSLLSNLLSTNCRHAGRGNELLALCLDLRNRLWRSLGTHSGNLDGKFLGSDQSLIR